MNQATWRPAARTLSRATAALIALWAAAAIVGGCSRSEATRPAPPATIAAQAAESQTTASPSSPALASPSAGTQVEEASPAASATADVTPTAAAAAVSRIVILHTNDNLGETEECG